MITDNLYTNSSHLLNLNNITFPHKISKQSLTSRSKNLSDHFDQVSKLLDNMSYNINEKVNIDQITCQLNQYKSFNNFEIRHKSTNYFKLFHQKRLKAKNYFQRNRKIKGQIVYHYTEHKKCENQVHISYILEIFQTILYKVISQELTGNTRNKKKILKTLKKFLLTAKNESFNLLNLIKKINIRSIKWLQEIKEDHEKYILLEMFIYWLFQYFIKIILDNFYVAYVKRERVFIFYKNWIIQKNNYLKVMHKKFTLEPINKMHSKTHTENKLLLIPKYKGLRSLIIQKYSNKEKQELQKIMSVLKYLYQTHLDETNNNIDNKYVQLVTENINNSNKKMYIIASDICNAYDSIRQDKLFDILKEMFDDLPNKLTFEQYKNSKYKFIKINTNLLNIEYKNNKQFENLNKNYILRKLQQFIYNTTVVINNKVYNLCKGIAQGLMLSSILCSIYYAHMRKKYFYDFKEFGYYFTYVDDSIYFTPSIKHAKQYLNRIANGIPEYNCWFNKLKLKYNFNYCNTYSKKIEYLGWVIDSNSLEIEPKFNVSRYSINFTKNECLKINPQMHNLNSLKLNKLILCKEINSEKKIFNNVKLIAMHHAKRCFVYAYSASENEAILSETVKKLNSRILYRIEKLINWDKYEQNQKRKKLQLILWKSFYDVFKKKRNIFVHLIKDFKKLMQNKKYIH